MVLFQDSMLPYIVPPPPSDFCQSIITTIFVHYYDISSGACAGEIHQLLRQQALADGIAASGRYNLVVSRVAYDSRNEALIGCLREMGVDDFSTGWGPLFAGRASFATFMHQQWVTWVRQHDLNGRWAGWLAYVSERYGYSR